MKNKTARLTIINTGIASALLIALGTAAGQSRSRSPQLVAATQSSSIAQVTHSGSVPKMPPMASDPKRDAEPPADAATKEKIKAQVKTQVSAAVPRMSQAASATLKPAENDAPEIQVLKRQKVFVNTSRAQGGQTKGSLIQAQAPPLLARNQPPAASNPMAHAPQPLHTCMQPQVHTVNGQNSGIVFTQDPEYNDYIIAGCGFGSQPGRIYLSGAVTGGRINLVVKPGQWKDSQVEAMVQPGLSGVLDGWPDLIVTAANGSSAKFPNTRFYAERKSVLLASIPRERANLANVKVGDSTHGLGTMYCPGPDLTHLFPCIAYNAGPTLDGISNGHGQFSAPNEIVSNAVDRDGGQSEFPSGEDVYDLSSMAPGFEIDYGSAYWYAWTSDVCAGWASDAFPKKPGDSVAYDTQGHYAFFKKTKTKFVVDWGVDHCGWRWLGVFRVNDWYNSGYSLQVFVKGPIGIDPWTGHAINTAPNLGAEQQPKPLLR